ncbi:phosphatidylinositol-specific phospholipase C domain-containing protein [[Clostridium] colinum]|uniref:phosphatidylinositol-specific phospholipase C domain-containing protein n=1 Tax=[Clostridium] colinum TaxID=36835 RepID=UPI0020250B53|nr:phosphatidylinositol-specific phospholipase C domain-containing protein [[Clostridium] colinum]
MRRIFLTLFIGIMIFSMPQMAMAHYDTAYWHETYITKNNSDWMKYVDGNMKISELSIPGTHDSMAYRSDLSAIDNTRTQTMNLRQQLESGIRYIDIRVKDNGNNNFVLHHGPVYLGFSFDYVLDELHKFLNEYPSESVFMRIKQEQSSSSDEKMLQIFSKYYSKYNNLFWKKEDRDTENPTLDEVRGKVVILSDVLSLNYYGINYRDISVQDVYHLNTNWELYSKSEKIKKFALDINNNSNSTLSINYLSASGGVFPYFVASGHARPQTNSPHLSTGLTTPAFNGHYPDFPRFNRVGALATISFEGTNTLFADLIKKENLTYTGIVAADFPGERLIQAIINLNIKKIENGNYFISLKNSENAVLDRNLLTEDYFTFWTYNGGENQKWEIKYDENEQAYQIKSYENDSKVLAWNDFNGLNQVFITHNQFKPEHYWYIYPYKDGYVIRNYKNQDLYLSKDSSSKNGQRLILKKLEKYEDVVFNLELLNK